MATTCNNMSTYFCATFEFFTVYTKLAEMVVLALNDLTTVKKLPPVGMQEIITGLRVQCLAN